MGRVRALVESDIDQVTTLHQAVYGSESPHPELRRFLGDIFLHHPWADASVPSLVYEDDEGRVVGTLGVMRRPMTLDGKPVRAVVTHDFMVEPGSRATMAALELMKRVAAGPQDLVLCEGNDSSRRLWEVLDGRIAFGHSLRWIRPLRPVQFVTSYWNGSRAAGQSAGGRRPGGDGDGNGHRAGRASPERASPGRARGVASAVRPLARMIDTALAGHSGSPFQRPRPEATGAPLLAGDLLRGIDEVARRYSLKPSYDERSLQWLLEILGRSERHGTLRSVKVGDAEGGMLGWYIYCAKRGGISEVVQLAARRDALARVVDHLFADAWSAGSVAVSGGLQPELYRPLSQKRCFFDNAGFWLLFGASDEALVDALHSGDAFLTRLEGEGWMRLAF